MTPTDLPDWAEPLGLRPHPEGGHYVEMYRSTTPIVTERGERPSATTIHFLLMPGEESAWHRVASDEIWLHTRGGRLNLVLGGDGERPGGEETVVLGPDPSAGDVFQGVVPAGHWQRAEPAGDEPVLVSCVVTPGFVFEDFELLG